MRRDLETDGMSLEGKHIAIKNLRSQAVNISTTRVIFPSTASPGQCRVQVPVGQYGRQWISIRWTDIFNCSKHRRRIEKKPWDCHHPNHLDLEAQICTTFLGGRCLCPYALAGQALQQKTTHQRIANYRISRSRRVIENISGKVHSTTGTEAKSCERHCVNMCGAT